MSDARWFEIEREIAAAASHFARAAELFDEGGFEGDDRESYRARMAFMHAMQSGHTSMESAFVRILKLFGEDLPTGADWHADLIRRVSNQIGNRPPIVAGAVAVAADETRRFRNVAMRSYDDFLPRRAQEPASAAGFLAKTLTDAITSFRASLDP